MQLKSMVGVCLIVLSVAMLPFVTIAQSSKQPESNLVCECCGQKNCPCCKDKIVIPQQRIAACGFSRPIRVATMVNNRPFGWAEKSYRDGKQAFVSKGYGINMFEEIAKKLNLRYVVVGYDKDQEAISDLKKGKLDLLVGLYNPTSTAGKNTMAVYPSMFPNVLGVYYLKENAFEVTGDESLKNKKGVMRRTENIYPLYSARITPDMSITLETTEDSFRKLLTGEADYLIGSPYSVEAELRRYKLHNKIVASPHKLMYASLFMVLTRVNDCFKLASTLGEGIKAYNANQAHVNQELNKVIDEWGKRFESMPGLEEKLAEKSEETDKNPGLSPEISE